MSQKILPSYGYCLFHHSISEVMRGVLRFSRFHKSKEPFQHFFPLQKIGKNFFPLFCLYSTLSALDCSLASASFITNSNLFTPIQDKEPNTFRSKFYKQRQKTFMSTDSSSFASSAQGGGNVIVIGSANQDLVAYTPRLPVPGETILGNSFETFCGGKGANQAVAASSLGLAPVSIICKVGNDSFGHTLLSNFRKSIISVFVTK